ncbi:(d)CMP kinase [Enterovirga sp. CN4-39]|uniref:(d)CMP kinase n=1 Tax=Enterovirga sp. CN4-39 TaxID=3400910 RepID=UPI003C0EFDBC
MIIAIDGPAASGKGTLARRLARHLGRPHLDTGLLYRAVARDLLDRREPLSDPDIATRAAGSLDLAGLDDPRLRSRDMGEAASIVSAFAGVRETLLGFQRRFAGQEGGAVLDGRDIGTVVCPEADLKFYVTATPEERARRRQRELAQSGEPSDFADVLADIQRRDARDQGRPNAPLKMASDAILLDTTELDAEAAFREALGIVESRMRA